MLGAPRGPFPFHHDLAFEDTGDASFNCLGATLTELVAYERIGFLVSGDVSQSRHHAYHGSVVKGDVGGVPGGFWESLGPTTISVLSLEHELDTLEGGFAVALIARFEERLGEVTNFGVGGTIVEGRVLGAFFVL